MKSSPFRIPLTMLALLTFASLSGFAQGAPPSTDIFLVEMSEGRIPQIMPGARNVTRRAGYDNQPFFLPGGRSLLYTSQRDGQTDIYRCDVVSGETTRLTETSESEYSPTLMPSGKEFSVVRVESDGTQRLWSFPIEGGQPRLLLSDVRPVGYHAWLDSSHVALFVLGEPPTLQVADLESGQARTILSNPGRSFNVVADPPGVTFIHQESSRKLFVKRKTWTIKRLNAAGEISELFPALEGSQDFCWLTPDTALMGKGSELYARSPRSPKWSLVVDLEDDGIKGITRIAFAPGRMAIVARAGAD